MATVIIPAHNEARVIGRLIGGQLVHDAGPGELHVIVVANGCTDDTAQVSHWPAGRWFGCSPFPTPSKRDALLAGDRAARSFPRIYVDADVALNEGHPGT